MVLIASDPAENPYWKRDMRRAYPQLSVVTQEQLSGFLIQRPAQEAYECITLLFMQNMFDITSRSVAAPNVENKDRSIAPATSVQIPELTVAIATTHSERPLYTENNLPPSLPTPFKKWKPQAAPDAPHDPHAYFPMILVK